MIGKKGSSKLNTKNHGQTFAGIFNFIVGSIIFTEIAIKSVISGYEHFFDDFDFKFSLIILMSVISIIVGILTVISHPVNKVIIYRFNTILFFLNLLIFLYASIFILFVCLLVLGGTM